jgi:hypothetical protein
LFAEKEPLRNFFKKHRMLKGLFCPGRNLYLRVV